MKRTIVAVLTLAAAAGLVLAAANPALLQPGKLTEKAPDLYKVKFETTKGSFTVQVHRDWAPNGADRFYNLVKNGYYDGCAFFRAVKDFMVQFGINGDPAVNQVWMNARIPDDPVKKGNTRGRITYAMAGPGTRTTQVFINYKNNAFLDGQGFAAFGEVGEDGMKVVDSLYTGYGDTAKIQGQLYRQGTPFLLESFPKLDYIKKATIVP